MRVVSANISCPHCNGRLIPTGTDIFRCAKCAGLLEQSPSAGWREIGAIMGTEPSVGGSR